MEGRRFERRRPTVRRPASSGPSTSPSIDQAARYRDRMVAPVAVTFVVLQAVLWIGAVVAIRRGAPAGRRAVALAALAMLAFLPATYLAGLIDFHAVAGHRLLGVRGRAGGRAWRSPPRRSAAGRMLDPLLLCLGVVFGLLVVDMLARRAPAAEHRVRVLADGRAVGSPGWATSPTGSSRAPPSSCAGCCRAGSAAAASARPSAFGVLRAWPS